VWDEATRTLQCFSSFTSPASNFTSCPRSIKDRRLMVRGLCSQRVFQSSYIDSGSILLHQLFGYERPGQGPGARDHNRAYWSKVVSWIDAILTGMMFWVVLWMAEKEKHSVVENDMARSVILATHDSLMRVCVSLKPRIRTAPSV